MKHSDVGGEDDDGPAFSDDEEERKYQTQTQKKRGNVSQATTSQEMQHVSSKYFRRIFGKQIHFYYKLHNLNTDFLCLRLPLDSCVTRNSTWRSDNPWNRNAQWHNQWRQASSWGNCMNFTRNPFAIPRPQYPFRNNTFYGGQIWRGRYGVRIRPTFPRPDHNM